jgi:hypothetical protein
MVVGVTGVGWRKGGGQNVQAKGREERVQLMTFDGGGSLPLIEKQKQIEE